MQATMPLCARAVDTPPSVDVYGADFTQQYTELTKQILLASIDLERFSLNYRLKSAAQPKYRRLRFFLAQETGAACGLAFQTVAIKQFAVGRRRPLKISKPALHGALATIMTGSIIAGSDSCLELGLNGLLALKHRQEGFDPASAKSYVCDKLQQIDQLLAKRDALVQSHPDHPGYSRAVLEGKVLAELRKSFINEFATFNADSKGYTAFINTFFLLNAATNAVASTAAGLAYKGVNTPKFNGPTNILFMVTGAMIMASPLVSTLVGGLVHKHSYYSFLDRVGGEPKFDTSVLATARRQLTDKVQAEGSLVPSLPAVDRFALYSESGALFRKQIINESTTMRHLEKVAVESNLLGPIIGGTLLTQGILGTTGYYRYTFRPRKQLALDYRGAIVGCTGSSLATVGTAAWYLASLAYENHLRKKHSLPAQLIEDRLAHIDDIEKIIRAM
ncbi:MAG: hypothetical protein C5B53_13345 [Candidatus Melainabacteria bacterium]|nr:MAG: hypothetical protein C5B53_13345 [Candidatus Melainabacteria bacterium]